MLPSQEADLSPILAYPDKHPSDQERPGERVFGLNDGETPRCDPGLFSTSLDSTGLRQTEATSCEATTKRGITEDGSLVDKDKPTSSWSGVVHENSEKSKYPTLFAIFSLVIKFLDFDGGMRARGVCRGWYSVLKVLKPLMFPAVYHLPVELIQYILRFTTVVGFDNARLTCKAWYMSSLSVPVLKLHLAGIGFGKTDSLIRDSKDPRYLAKRLHRECCLGAGGTGICHLRNVAVLDMSEVTPTKNTHFTVSTCGTHALICEGCVVYVYRLKPADEELAEFVACVVCPRRVLAVSMDTSSRRYSVAILLVSTLRAWASNQCG
jgi:hypothetical protein